MLWRLLRLSAPRGGPVRSAGIITSQRDMSSLIAALFMLQSHAHFRLRASLSPPSYRMFNVQLVWSLACFFPDF